MVTLAGAIQAMPLVAQIQILNNAVTQLAAAIASNDTISQLILQLPDTVIVIPFAMNTADSTAIFNDIKNILANDVNITTNSLGAIT